MAFSYFPVLVEAIPREGEAEVDPALATYANVLDARSPQRSVTSGDSFSDHAALHQAFALKIEEGDDLATKVVDVPAAMMHVAKRIGPNEWIWIPGGAQPAALIYEVEGLGFLGIRPKA